MSDNDGIDGTTDFVEVRAFGHKFAELPGNAEDLITLEREGAIYSHFWHEPSQAFRFYKVRFLPDEIFQYVEAHVARGEFMAAIQQGRSFQEALTAISNREIAQRVLSYGDYGRTKLKDGKEVDIRGCAASFFPPGMEELVCGQRPDRYELLPNLTSSDRTSIIIKIIDSFPVVSHHLRNRRKGKQAFDIEDEYDVQDLLYVSIRSVFEDARLEEWTPKHAGAAKRIDIVVPSLDVVLEVKRVRDRAHARGLADELKVDIESYHAHQNCKSLIFLVSDPDSWVGDPAALSNDLSGLRVKGNSTFDVKVMIRR